MHHGRLTGFAGGYAGQRFGKRGGQNWKALRALERIVAIGPRVLVGTSRKRFLAEALAGLPVPRLLCRLAGPNPR